MFLFYKYFKCSVYLALALQYGCLLNVISDYDEESLFQMEQIAENIDRMYIHMSHVDRSERTFINFKDYYINVAAGLNRLKSRQESRPFNELTLKQVDIVINSWNSDIERHKNKVELGPVHTN